MPSVYHENAFSYRVDFAAAYISAGRNTTRHFDTCFEMHDGDVVAAALVRRANKNPGGRLAANLYRYIDKDLAQKNASDLAHITTKGLAKVAAQMRASAA